MTSLRLASYNSSSRQRLFSTTRTIVLVWAAAITTNVLNFFAIENTGSDRNSSASLSNARKSRKYPQIHGMYAFIGLFSTPENRLLTHTYSSVRAGVGNDVNYRISRRYKCRRHLRSSIANSLTSRLHSCLKLFPARKIPCLFTRAILQIFFYDFHGFFPQADRHQLAGFFNFLVYTQRWVPDTEKPDGYQKEVS